MGHIVTPRRSPRRSSLLLAALAILAGLSVALFSAAASREVPAGSPRFTPGPTATQERPRAVFVGDSYTAGAGGDGFRWTSEVAKAQGWREINLGRGGTGFAMTAGVRACGLDYCPSFREMVAVAADRAPQIVVVSGGRNDAGQVRAEVEATFEELRAALPDARIIAVSPMYDDDPYPAGLHSLAAVVRESVEGVGGEYLDIGHPLEGRPDLITKDGVHPNHEGHRALAAAVNAALGSS